MTDPARGGGDEDVVLRCEPTGTQRPEGDLAVAQQRDGDRIADRLRHGGGDRHQHRGEFGVGTPKRYRHHPLPDLPSVHARTDGGHPPGDLTARRARVWHRYLVELEHFRAAGAVIAHDAQTCLLDVSGRSGRERCGTGCAGGRRRREVPR